MRTVNIKNRSNENSVIEHFMVFKSEYNPDFILQIKQIDRRWWDKENRAWEVPITLTNIKELVRIIKEFDFTIEFDKEEFKAIVDEIKAIINKERTEQKEYEAILRDSKYCVYAKKTDDMKLFCIFDYSTVLVEDMKEIPNAKFIKNSRRTGWEIEITSANIREVIEYLRKPYVYCSDSKLLSKLSKMIKNQDTLFGESKAIEYKNDLKIDGLAYELRPFQKAGVKYALSAKKLFIADDMGCGKTIEALATFQASKSKCGLVVCPSAVKYNWLVEANKWIPSRKAVVLEIDKKKGAIKDIGELNIINYDMLTKIWPYIKDFDIDFCIFDECHKLKSKKTGWSKTALEISRCNVNYILMLSGTPMPNRPSELVHQLNIIDRLKYFGGEFKFKMRYCDMVRNAFGWDDSGASNLDELNEILRSTCYIRRMKNQVLTELPPKQRSYIPVVLDTKYRKIYRDAEKDIAKWILNSKEEMEKFFSEQSNENLKNRTFFELITRSKVRKAETLMKITKLRKIAAEAKINSFIEWTEDFMLNGDKLVIFAYHKDIIDTLAKALDKYGVAIINGEIGDKEKQLNVEKFQKDPNTKLIICNLKAGGVGITLTAASNVAFIEYDWTPANLLQAEDRIYRQGQINTSNIWYFYTKDTIDLDLIELLQEKDKVINTATDGSINNESDFLVNKVISNLLKNHTKLLKRR